MHAKVEKYLDAMPDVMKTKIFEEGSDNIVKIIAWRTWGDIVACEYLSGPLKGHTSILHEGVFYDQDEFLRVLKMKAFW